jgi:hypothetical protein
MLTSTVSYCNYLLSLCSNYNIFILKGPAWTRVA